MTNGLQFGFSPGKSPSMASLVLTEAIAEAKVNKKPLYVASLDARKAFDVVDHHLMKIKLFHTPLKKPIWSVIDDMYVGGSDVIRSNNLFSRPYTVTQGVKQGGILSPTLYKLYIFELLESLKRATIGLQIGCIYTGTPTCADDVLHLSNSVDELQGMLTVNSVYSARHHYELHPKKSTITPMYQPLGHKDDHFTWKLGKTDVPVVSEFTHLGLDWIAGKGQPDVSRHIVKARRTAYSRLGAGLHGQNGMDPRSSARTIQLYVMPRLVHGLEATILRRGDVVQLEIYYRKLLRQVQSLPESTAMEAVYLMIGLLPIEALIHQRALSLFGSISRLEPTDTLYQLALRQMSVKTPNSDSWFSQIRQFAAQYDLDLDSQLAQPWPKETWKAYCRNTVRYHWWNKLVSAAAEKSTLRYILWDNTHGRPHGLWSTCNGRVLSTQEAAVRAKLMVNRAGLRAAKWQMLQTLQDERHYY